METQRNPRNTLIRDPIFSLLNFSDSYKMDNLVDHLSYEKFLLTTKEYKNHRFNDAKYIQT
jgi:hypothetical protein